MDCSEKKIVQYVNTTFIFDLGHGKESVYIATVKAGFSQVVFKNWLQDSMAWEIQVNMHRKQEILHFVPLG